MLGTQFRQFRLCAAGVQDRVPHDRESGAGTSNLGTYGHR